MKKVIFFLIIIQSALTGSIFAQNISKGVTKVKLDNGLTAIIKENHSQPVVSVQVWVKVGSVNENADQKGLTHFIEHLIFKGSKKYPGDEISRRVESNGGIINAATSKEYTHYHIDSQKEGVEDAVRILADAMANAEFPETEIEKERPVVVEEIVRHFDNPGGVLYDNFSRAIFFDTPYKFSIIGSSDIIKNVTRKEIVDYYRNWYAPGNMYVSIVGDFDPGAMNALIKETFGAQPGLNSPSVPALTEKKHGPRDVLEKKDVEHDYLLAGFLGPDVLSDDQFAADVTSMILGGGRTSRLYRSLREDKRLVYAVAASFGSQRGTGNFVIQAVFQPGKEKDVLKATDSEIALLMDKGPTDEELKRAKMVIRSEWYFDLESFHEQAANLGYWNMQGNPSMPDTYIPGIDKVSTKDVRDFLKNYYEGQKLSYALLEPKK